ncbi:MAG: hypothetical protein ACM3S1_12275 [Hyphomicrobiales bacterium]
MRPLARLLATLLALLLVLPACGGKDSSEAPTAVPSETSQGAPAGASASPTGTPQPMPQSLKTVLDRVAEVRELSAPDTIRVEFVSRSDLPALLQRLTTGDDRRWFAQTTRLYRLLGHLRDDQDYETVYNSFGGDAVLGLYSPLDKALWVVHEDGEDVDLDNLSRPLEETLAHEFVHALQDYHFDLATADDAFEDNLDVSHTWTAIVEGDAVTNEQLYTQRFAMLPGGTVIVTAANAQIRDVPPSIIRELYFPYTTGADFVRSQRDQKGSQQIDAWLQNPPAGSAFILHPELLDNGWQPESVTLPDLTAALGEGWTRDSGGSLGEFNLRNWLQLQVRASEAIGAAQGWDGDRYDVYANGGDSVAAFRVHFANETEANEFRSAQDAFVGGAEADIAPAGGQSFATFRDGDVMAIVNQPGNDVLFVIASNRALAEKALGALLHG